MITGINPDGYKASQQVIEQTKIGDRASWTVQLSWYNLAFTAGLINAGGLLACHRFVSHVTGFVTLSGVDFVRNSWREGIAALALPGFFMLGAMTSAWFSEPRPGEKSPRSITPALILVALVMATAVVLGHAGAFGPFGITEDIMQDYLLLVMLSFACGIQNAAATSATGASIRPTHLTGTTTDLGISIVRAAVQPKDSEARTKEMTVTLRRVGLIVAFVVGAICGANVFSQLEYTGFLLPLVTSIAAIILNIRSLSLKA